jgi:hypothetical protein
MYLPLKVASIFDVGLFLNIVGYLVVYNANSTVSRFAPNAAMKTEVQPVTAQPLAAINAVVRRVVKFLLSFVAKIAQIAKADAPVAKMIF